jgi:SM-20-related protein
MSDAVPPPLTINPALDVPALATRFAQNQRMQIADFLTPDSAEALRTELLASSAWRHVIKGEEKVFEVARRDFEAMPPSDRARIDDAVHAGAARGFQFRYDVIRVPDERSKRAGIDTRLAEFTRLMSRADVLRLIHAVTGAEPLAFADAQATLYRPGDFLTRHDDEVAGKHRKLAYVLGLTEGWQPEWGGLLLFNDDTGGVAETLVPRFNTLSLFSVPQPHSVGFVAPYADQPRLSVTGWIRSAFPKPDEPSAT